MQSRYLFAGAVLLMPLAIVAAGCNKTPKAQPTEKTTPIEQQAQPTAQMPDREHGDRAVTTTHPNTETSANSSLDQDLSALDRQVDALNSDDFDPKDLPKDYNQIK